jgi:hypothetical protein
VVAVRKSSRDVLNGGVVEHIYGSIYQHPSVSPAEDLSCSHGVPPGPCCKSYCRVDASHGHVAQPGRKFRILGEYSEGVGHCRSTDQGRKTWCTLDVWWPDRRAPRCHRIPAGGAGPLLLWVIIRSLNRAHARMKTSHGQQFRPPGVSGAVRSLVLGTHPAGWLPHRGWRNGRRGGTPPRDHE